MADSRVTYRQATEAIATQVCWCGAGPFRAIAGHTRIVHGVTAGDLRNAAGLVADQPWRKAATCSPATSDRVAETSEEARRRWSERRAEEAERKAGEIVSAWREGADEVQLADRFGLTPQKIRNLLRREGIEVPDRRPTNSVPAAHARIAELRRNPEWRAILSRKLSEAASSKVSKHG